MKRTAIRAALLAAVALTVVPAIAAPVERNAPSAGDRDARIDALEAQLKQIAAELQALKAERPAPGPTGTAAVSTAPSSAATAGGGQPATASAVSPASGSPRIFGPGIPTTAAVASIDSGRPVIATPDGRFSANLLAIMQFDVADYFQRRPGPLATDLRRGGAPGDTAHARDLSDGSTFRRARLGIAGRAFGDFEYTALFDFGGAGVEDNGHVQELWLQYSGLRPLHVRVGAFPPLLGLEDAGSSNGMLFLERPAATDIARGLAGGDYREGGQVTANTERLFASAAVTGRTVNTAGASGTQPYNSQLGFTGRAAAVAYRDKVNLLHVGVHGSYVAHPADNGGPDAAATALRTAIDLRERPELRVDGTRLIDTGAINAAHAYTAGAELAVQHHSVLVQAEYEHVGIERYRSPLSDPGFDGFYVEGSWLITGETRFYNTGNFAFDGPKVQAFDPRHGKWGAFELAARYSDMNLNYRQGTAGSAPAPDAVRGGEQQIVTLGLNWYLNPIMRVMLDYQHVDISRLSPSAATFQTPVGAQIGQRYSTGEARFQFAF